MPKYIFFKNITNFYNFFIFQTLKKTFFLDIIMPKLRNALVTINLLGLNQQDFSSIEKITKYCDEISRPANYMPGKLHIFYFIYAFKYKKIRKKSYDNVKLFRYFFVYIRFVLIS